MGNIFAYANSARTQIETRTDNIRLGRKILAYSALSNEELVISGVYCTCLCYDNTNKYNV